MTIFKGDHEMFHKTRISVRKNIEMQADETDTAKINQYLFEYEEGRRQLEQGVVQGNLQQDGTYRWKVRKEHAMGASVKE